MRICVIATSFPKNQKDLAGSFILEQLKFLPRNIKFDIITPDRIDCKKFEKYNRNIIVHRFSYFWPRKFQAITQSGIYNNLKKISFAWFQLPIFTIIFIIKTLFISKNSDVIHAHWIFSGFIGAIAKNIYLKPLILTIHGSDINLLPKQGPVNKLAKWILSNCDKVITVNKALYTKTRQLGVEKERLVLIANAVDLKKYSTKVVEENILCIGRIVEIKGHKYLIDAMKSVVDEYPSAKLLIAGDGDLEAKITNQIHRLGIAKNIKLVGRLPQDKIPEFLTKGKIFILPSLNEGLPLTLLEAMASEKCIIATKVGGIPEVIDSTCGILVPPNNSQALSRAIKKIYLKKQTQKKLGRTARCVIKNNYNINESCQKLNAIYTYLADSSK